MNKSESIAKLAEALSKMQSQLKNSEIDGENLDFDSKYSTLSAVWDACRTPLTNNGLSIIQIAVNLPEILDWVSIETILLHISGEWVSGVMSARLDKTDPQAVGSCVTYLRRYSLAAMCGISPADDDGNAATYKLSESSQSPSPSQKKMPVSTEMASDKQVKAIYAIIKARSPNTDHCLWVNDALGLLGKIEELENISPKTLTKDMVKNIFDKFKLLKWVKEEK